MVVIPNERGWKGVYFSQKKRKWKIWSIFSGSVPLTLAIHNTTTMETLNLRSFNFGEPSSMTADCTLLFLPSPGTKVKCCSSSPLDNGLFQVPTFSPVVEVQSSFPVAQFGPKIPDRWFDLFLLHRWAAILILAPLHYELHIPTFGTFLSNELCILFFYKTTDLGVAKLYSLSKYSYIWT